MIGKRQAVARVLRASGALSVHRAVWRTVQRRRLLVFNYHRIMPDDPTFEPAFEEDVYHTTVSRFAAQVSWLRRHTQVLSEERLLAHLAGEQYRGRRPASMITFDDGYADNFELAFPVLRRQRVPAMIFAVSTFIESGIMGWWDQIANVIKRSPREEIQLDGANFRLPHEARQAADHFQERMKLEPSLATRDLPERLAEACWVDMPTPVQQRREMLTWDQLRELDANGMRIGAHTHTHRVLGTLSAGEQREELDLCREILEEQLGRRVRSVSYPVGGAEHLTAETTAIAREAGFLAGFTYLTGSNRWRSMDPMRIARMEGPRKVDLLAARVSMPDIFG